MHYRLEVPQHVGRRILLSAKVNHRKFSWRNTQFAYAGVVDPQDSSAAFTKDYDDRKWIFTGDTSDVSGKLKEVPDLPITTMASATAELRVSETASSDAEVSLFRPEDAQRWNNYGVGLLLHRDYEAAEDVFREIAKTSPEYGDSWINLARAVLKQGRPDEAQVSLLKAADLDTDPGKVHFFLGVTAIDQGNLAEAIDHLKKADALYPKDRRIIFQLGRTLLLQQQYEDAIEIFQRGVKIDPEDFQFHHQLSLCYEKLGDSARAEREKLLVERFRPRIAAPFGSGTPEDENERRLIHEHGSYPIDLISNEESESGSRLHSLSRNGITEIGGE